MFVIDSAPSAVEHMPRLLDVVDALVDPPCISRSTPGGGPQHRCDPNNADDVRALPAIESLRVGVVSADLGAPGSQREHCETPRGLDARIGPRVTAPRLRTAADVTSERSTFEPSETTETCGDLPAFLSFCGTTLGCRYEEDRGIAATRDPSRVRRQFACHAAATQGRCALSQPLEAMWRALVEHGADRPLGSPEPNAGFLRPDAILAIVVLSTGEDHSVRDCTRDQGFSATRGDGQCRDAQSAFVASSTQWSHADVERRFYPDALDSALDPTWNLDRYLPVDGTPRSSGRTWGRDLGSLKPGHPERILFAAITGAPTNVPRVERGWRTTFDWDALATRLTPSFDERCGHIAAVCHRGAPAENPSSVCRNEAPVALPARRIVELARRFDEAPRCNGAPCGTGTLDSVCDDRFTNTIRMIRDRTARWGGRCLPRVLVPERGADGLERVPCSVRVLLREGQACDAANGQRQLEGSDGAFVSDDGSRWIVCEVDQIATHPADAGERALAPASNAPGWYYDRSVDPENPTCTQRIAYTRRANTQTGSIGRLECTQRVYDVPCAQ